MGPVMVPCENYGRKFSLVTRIPHLEYLTLNIKSVLHTAS